GGRGDRTLPGRYARLHRREARPRFFLWSRRKMFRQDGEARSGGRRREARRERRRSGGPALRGGRVLFLRAREAGRGLWSSWVCQRDSRGRGPQKRARACRECQRSGVRGGRGRLAWVFASCAIFPAAMLEN